MSKYQYNSWPLGKVPEEFQRSEINQLRNLGYKFDDAREVVDIFEEKVAEFAGSKYAAAVDCCSHGLFLCLKYIAQQRELYHFESVVIPRHTYISVPMQIKHAGFEVEYDDIEWSGEYQLKPTRIHDSAVRWKRGMYLGYGKLQVLSFQIKKTIPIGKGGMVLTDDPDAYRAIKLMSYDGRDLRTKYDSKGHVKCYGYHYYMTPEDAARGIMLMDSITTEGDSANHTNYPDVEEMMNNI